MHRAFFILSGSLSLLACSSPSTQPSDGGTVPESGTPDAGITVTVTPQPKDVLTCSKVAFSATVTGTTNTAVTWSVAPATGSGTIDATGSYAAPIVTPSPDTATVTATSQADPSAFGTTAPFTLATAFPDTPVSITGSIGSTLQRPGIYQHWTASNGARVYAAWPVAAQDNSSASVMIARSDDSGQTWAAPKTAMTTTLDNKTGYIDCVAMAVDPANPDVVYLTGQVSDYNALGDSVPSEYAEPTVFFSVSTDGGATFTTRVMVDGNDFYCSDIAAPAPNTVVMESPSGGCGQNEADMRVFSDANQGAGFANGTGGPNKNYTVTGTGSLFSLISGCPNDINVYNNNSNSGSGQAIESPRLFTDGKGRLCVTYIGDAPHSNPTSENVYVQCSDDAGTTFSPPLVVDPALGALQHNQATGALGPNKAAAIAWTTEAKNLYVATSKDAGATFGTPVKLPSFFSNPAASPTLAYDASGTLWVAYVISNPTDRVIVDKSCDGGTTWSGPVSVNPKGSNVGNLLFPSFALIPSSATPRVFGYTTNLIDSFSLAPH